MNGKKWTKQSFSISIRKDLEETVFRGYKSDGTNCSCDIDGNNIYITFNNKIFYSLLLRVLKPQTPSTLADTK